MFTSLNFNSGILEASKLQFCILKLEKRHVGSNWKFVCSWTHSSLPLSFLNLGRILRVSTKPCWGKYFLKGNFQNAWFLVRSFKKSYFWLCCSRWWYRSKACIVATHLRRYLVTLRIHRLEFMEAFDLCSIRICTHLCSYRSFWNCKTCILRR